MQPPGCPLVLWIRWNELVIEQNPLWSCSVRSASRSQAYHTSAIVYLVCGTELFGFCARGDPSPSQCSAHGRACRKCNIFWLPRMYDGKSLRHYNEMVMTGSWCCPCEPQSGRRKNDLSLAPSWHCWGTGSMVTGANDYGMHEHEDTLPPSSRHGEVDMVYPVCSETSIKQLTLSPNRHSTAPHRRETRPHHLGCQPKSGPADTP